MNKQNATAALTSVATYQPPRTIRTSVQAEGGFCASADVKNPDAETNGRVAPHQVNDGFGYDYSSDGWEDVTNN